MKQATRYYCEHSFNDKMSFQHTAGSGTATRKRCARCGGRLLIEAGLWGAFQWNSDNQYPESAAKETFTSETRAERYAEPRSLVVRWIYA